MTLPDLIRDFYFDDWELIFQEVQIRSLLSFESNLAHYFKSEEAFSHGIFVPILANFDSKKYKSDATSTSLGSVLETILGILRQVDINKKQNFLPSHL